MNTRKLDKLNVKILEALEANSRQSLKELAAKLNIKTSTIYHRLHFLKECKILEGFSIILDPDRMNLLFISFLTISLRKPNVINQDRLFLESFAQYLANESNILFISTSETKVHVISCHVDSTAFEEFLKQLRGIPYVESIDIIPFEKIIKGHRLFTFNPSYFDRPENPEANSMDLEKDQSGKPDSDKSNPQKKP